MNNSIESDISALMDDELPPEARDEIYQVLKTDAVLLDKWSRYHLISDALSHHLPEHERLSLDLADRVREAIDAEPTLFLPQNRTRRQDTEGQADEKARPSRPAWFMPAAAAATVAAVAILGLQLDRGADDPGIATMAVAPTEKVKDVAPVSFTASMPSTPPQWLRGQPPAPAQLADHLAAGGRPVRNERSERYLVEHNGIAAGAGVNAVFPYARMVSHDVAGTR